MLSRRRFAGYLAASALAPGCIMRRALAQAPSPPTWPDRPVRVICPIAAGGAIDAVTRLVAARLSDIWRQQVVVENRTGGSNNIAAEAVARSEPDGYTVFSATASLAMAGLLFPSLNHDPIADLPP